MEIHSFPRRIEENLFHILLQGFRQGGLMFRRSSLPRRNVVNRRAGWKNQPENQKAKGKKQFISFHLLDRFERPDHVKNIVLQIPGFAFQIFSLQDFP